MIVEQLPNGVPFIYGSGNAHKILGPALPEITDVNVPDFCICDYVPCVYVERVFATLLPNTDYWKNDKSDFLFKRFVAVDTVDMRLLKDGVEVTTLIDDTYGTYFGGFTGGSAEQLLYKGYLLDWKLVQADFGNGKYQLEAALDIVGVQTVFLSRDFFLNTFNNELANKTVRIETVQNGNIIGSQFDFTGLAWEGSVRVPATFGNPTPIYETTEYVTGQRVNEQIQSKVTREWDLNTRLISYDVAFSLLYNRLLANEILVTDYNIKAETVFRRVSVRTREIDKPKIEGRPEKIYNIKFADRKQKYIKRNF